MTKTARILLADDHEIVRRGLRNLIEDHPEWSVCCEAADGHEAVAEAMRAKPDVVVMDIAMPRMNGLEAARRIVEKFPRTEVLILTMHESKQLVQDVLKSGARGYILKSDAGKDLVAGIEALLEHKPFFSQKVSEVILDGFLKGKGGAAEQDELTPREREIVQLLAEGKSNKETAAVLDISVKTVEVHRANLMRKMGFNSLSDLVRYALREKMIEP
ncbi:MAG: response regulator transcription factor [Acidobacteriota bacterium]|nr:response regulator transcription factor [Acidobacteriota bacterium]